MDLVTDQPIEASRVSHSTVGGSPFPPIADYGFISDCDVCALIAPSGTVEWMCLPRMDGPSIFAAVLDRDAGRFRVGPADVTVPAGRRYLPGTMVLETTWDTPTGWAVVRDVLLIGPWRDDSRRSGTQRRAPTDNQAEKVLLRTIGCLNGSTDLLLEREPAFDYGRQRGLWRRASALCEKLLSFATLHLYAEEIDPHTGGHLGNFPQAFSHLAMINAVMHLIRADEEISRDRRFQAGHQLTVDGSDVRP